MLSLRVLGPVEVLAPDGTVVPLGAGRLRRLLVALASRAGTTLGVRWLAEAVWGDHQPARPAAAVQNLVFRLRAVLAPTSLEVVTEPAGYRLVVPPDGLDAQRFERAVTAVSGPDQKQAAAALDEALALWRGAPYADLVDEPTVMAAAVRLSALRLTTVERRTQIALTLGHADTAAAMAEPEVREHPLHESLTAQLMWARYQQGRQAEALQLYHALRRRLSDELGVEPAAAVTDRYLAILRHDRGLGAVGARGNLPGVPGLIGRDADLAAVTERLGAPGVVTVVGPGGVGKTSLAVTVAAAIAADRADGAWLVELAWLARGSSSSRIAAAVLGVLDVPLPPGPEEGVERLASYLTPRRMLLVLDNAEHVCEGTAAVVRAIRRRAPGVAVLVTSRRPLGAPDEQVVTVGPLLVRGAASPAVRLFLERARRVVPDFNLTAANRAAVRRICQSLDGLPLALELAAPRLRGMAPDALAERVSGRFDLLRGGSTSATDRHRTLHAVVDWSFQLLDDAQRRVFELVCVFSGAVDLRAVEALAVKLLGTDVAADVALADLVDRSLVAVLPSGRYAVLETIRTYGRAQLLARSEADRAARAHADLVVTRLAAGDRTLWSPGQPAAMAEVAAMWAEVRAAVAWSATHDRARGASLIGSLLSYVELRMPPEVGAWAQEWLAGPDQPGAGRVVAVAAAIARFGGDLAEASRLADRGLSSAALDPSTAAYLHYLLGEVALFDGDLDTAMSRMRCVLGIPSAVGVSGMARLTASLITGYAGDVSAAQVDIRVQQERHERTGNAVLAGWAAYVSGELCIDVDPPTAIVRLDDALRRARRNGDRYLTGVALVAAASVRSRHGDPHDALPLFVEAVTRWRDAADWTHQWTTLRNVVDLLLRIDAAEPAAVVLGALLSRPTTSGSAWGSDATRLQAAQETLVVRLGATRFEELRHRGASLTDDDLVAEVLDVLGAPAQGRSA